jgi:hypothetical protein
MPFSIFFLFSKWKKITQKKIQKDVNDGKLQKLEKEF